MALSSLPRLCEQGSKHRRVTQRPLARCLGAHEEHFGVLNQVTTIRNFKAPLAKSRIGVSASCCSRWFEQTLARPPALSRQRRLAGFPATWKVRTDLAILRAFADKLEPPSSADPFRTDPLFTTVANQPARAMGPTSTACARRRSHTLSWALRLFVIA
jgi:hypothetical protein